MKEVKFFVFIIVLTSSYAITPTKAKLEPLRYLRGNETALNRGTTLTKDLPSCQWWTDSISITWQEIQASGSFGQRMMHDDHEHAFISWMKLDQSHIERYCAWDIGYGNGVYHGEIPATMSWSGYVQLDVTRDANPDSQRTVIAYNAGGPYSWIDIAESNLIGSWPNDPKTPGVSNHLWPYVAVSNNGNIVMATGDASTYAHHHLYFTANEGETWALVADFDSCATLSQFVRASNNSGSNKIVFVHTQYITDTVAAGQLDNNVYYMLSIDGGLTWGAHTNITNYQPNDSIRAYCNVNAIFDLNDNLHITWAGRKVTDNYYEASKIFHWDETSNNITVVNPPSGFYNEPGGWWITTTGGGDPGAWRMPVDQPQLVIHNNGTLSCLYHGNDDYNDHSAAGYFNGELYWSGSVDNGATWPWFMNLTNTRSPGASPGECCDEDYMTVVPVGNGCVAPLFPFNFTFIEDKDAGAAIYSEGIETENPVRSFCYFNSGSVKEQIVKSIGNDIICQTIFTGPLNLPKGIDYKIYDILGRAISPRNIKPGIYFIEVDGKITQKVIKIK